MAVKTKVKKEVNTEVRQLVSHPKLLIDVIKRQAGSLKKAVLEGKLIPVLVGSAAKGIGIKELLDVIIDSLPSPSDTPPVEATEAITKTSAAIKK